MLRHFQIYVSHRRVCTIWAFDVDDAKRRYAERNGVDVCLVSAVDLQLEDERNQRIYR